MTNMLEVALQIVQDLDLPVFPCKEFINKEKGRYRKHLIYPVGLRMRQRISNKSGNGGVNGLVLLSVFLLA